MRFRTILILVTVMSVSLPLAACRESADDFFSGRPSGMAMVHNRIIGGPPETMVELLRVPARFPDAAPAHIADWQESVIAWWWSADRHALLVESFGKLTAEESRVLQEWLRVEAPSRSAPKAAALGEIAVAARAAREEGGRP